MSTLKGDDEGCPEEKNLAKVIMLVLPCFNPLIQGYK